MLAERETTVIMRREHERYHPAVVQAAPSVGLVLLAGAGRVGRYAVLLPAYILIALGAFGHLVVRECGGGHGLES